jgi:benzoyl-CoA reductase/2-hydroxyglutaryl-CoA dehydratase subunit BcrC/BadD/HgdB
MYAEVKERVDNGIAAVPNERVRILWSSIPPWFNLGFFNQWEESHGAVFLTDTYIAKAQRMIQRDRTNPIRASMLKRHMTYSGSSPMAAAEVVIQKAREYKCDGVIVPKRGASRDLASNSPFVEEFVRRAGIPVIALDFEPTNSSSWDDEKIRAQVTEFIESLKPERR